MRRCTSWAVLQYGIRRSAAARNHQPRVENLKDMGVKFETKQGDWQDLLVPQLLGEMGFDAAFVAPARGAAFLGIPGEFAGRCTRQRVSSPA